jgi:hypothetical protein
LIAWRVRLGSKLRQKWHPHWQDKTIVGDRLLMVLALMAASVIDSPPLEAMTKKIAVTVAGRIVVLWLVKVFVALGRASQSARHSRVCRLWLGGESMAG